MSDSSTHSRRTVLKVAGGAAGLAALPGRSLAQEGGDGERVDMVTTDAGAQIFSAPILWVEEGTTVTWNNRSGSHSSTAYAEANDRPQRIPDDAEAWDSGVLSEEGATFEYAFDTAGVYDYFCIPHEAMGMVGRVVVGSPELADQPALSEPQDDLPDTVQEILTNLNTVTESMFGEQ